MARKRINFFKALQKRFKGIPSLYKKTAGGISPIGTPIKMFRALKKGNKMTHKKHATLKALGKTIHTRVVNGPELNVLFLGIPFLIDFGVAYGKKHKNFVKITQDQPVRPGPQDQEEQVVVRFDPDAEVDGGTDVDMGQVDPLPQAPFSDQAFRMYTKFIEAGMTEKSARMFCNGELEGLEILDHFTDEDIEVFVRLQGTVLKEELVAA